MTIASRVAGRLLGLPSPTHRVAVERDLRVPMTDGGTQIHSLRLPSYSVSTEVIFGQAGERLMIRHEAGESPEPYVGGALLASAASFIGWV